MEFLKNVTYVQVNEVKLKQPVFIITTGNTPFDTDSFGERHEE